MQWLNAGSTDPQDGLSGRILGNGRPLRISLKRCRAPQQAACLAAALCFAAATLLAQEPASSLHITPDHTNGVYTPGQQIHWRIEPESLSRYASGSYALKRDGLTAIREGKLSLKGGEEVVASLDQPGTLLLEVKATDNENKVWKSFGGAVVSPDQITPSMPRPDDFDAFWQEKLQELSKVPPNPQLVPVDGNRPGVDYWQVAFDNIRGTHIRGQMARPKAGEKFPAMLIVQWAGVYGLQKEWVLDPAGQGWLVLNISAHDLPIDQPPAFYQKESQGPLKDYAAIGNDDRETSYFLRMYLSCYRAAQYLAERPDWDGKTLLVTGGSQGGLQALMTAGLHPRIAAAIANVPAGCDLTGPKAGRSPGWPMWYWKTEGKDANKVIEASRYYDVVNFASHITCPILVGIGLIDQTCPPAGIFAALNQVKGFKEEILLPKGDHQGTANSHQALTDRAAQWKELLKEGKPVTTPK